MGTGKREKVRREAEKMDSCASRAHTSNFHFARGSDEQRQPANPLRRRRVVARFREIRPSGGGGGGGGGERNALEIASEIAIAAEEGEGEGNTGAGNGAPFSWGRTERLESRVEKFLKFSHSRRREPATTLMIPE